MTLQELLKEIAKMLEEGPKVSNVEFLQTDGQKLWAILTALRGPDSDYPPYKRATTSIIRKAVGVPEDNVGGAIVNGDSWEEREIRRTMLKNHFSQHAQAAFNALGLKWDEVNEV